MHRRVANPHKLRFEVHGYGEGKPWGRYLTIKDKIVHPGTLVFRIINPVIVDEKEGLVHAKSINAAPENVLLHLPDGSGRVLYDDHLRDMEQDFSPTDKSVWILLNHDEHPNLELRDTKLPGTDRMTAGWFAKKTIRPGDVLCFRYEDAPKKWKCVCNQ